MPIRSSKYPIMSEKALTSRSTVLTLPTACDIVRTERVDTNAKKNGYAGKSRVA